MNRYYRDTARSAVTTAAAAAALICLAHGAQAEKMPATSAVSPDAAVLNYWTPERMKSAKVIDLRPVTLPAATRKPPPVSAHPCITPAACPP